MPTPDPRPALTTADVRALVAGCAFSPRAGAPHVGRVGLELEVFPVRRAGDGAPAGRVPLRDEGRPGTLRILDELAPRSGAGDVPRHPLARGTVVTVEPGGQVEVTTSPRATAAAALDDLAEASAALARVYGEQGVTLAAAGLDVWHAAGDVAQQLDAPRYPAMAAYFALRGPAGHAMMCHTAALQVNLCLGPPDVAGQRWLVANLLAPVVVATFAASPEPPAASGRARLWRRLDPTRTGVPRALVEGRTDDPVDQLVEAALAADVLLVRRPGGYVVGRPGWSFGTWLRHGDADLGRPTADDLTYHLTTLFPEVRARGFLEFRGVDALPARWRAVPVVLLAGALYDARATEQIRAVLERLRPRLPALLERAGIGGVADPAMCALAVECWSLALAGAQRLPAGYVRAADLRTAEEFLDHFTMRGRCPADECAERLAWSPAAALAWAGDAADTLVR
ncbi:MAG TPA: glutamate-cysteine ligase family protein [Egibacteraceae bacterium]|nr:glutamate-cysteine ligase family protein [Egibacteraceae bacterium]